MKKRGRKAKPLKEKKAELVQKIDKILLVASMVHNIQRNKTTRNIARHNINKLEKEYKASHKRDEKKTLKFIINDCQLTVDKMDSFINDDTRMIGKELKGVKINI